MEKLVTAEQMKQYDQQTIQQKGIPSLVLMERAALACVDELLSGRWNVTRVLAVCGPGNNGGDGVAIARILHEKGILAEIYCLGEEPHISDGMRKQKEIAENCGVPVVKNPVFGEYTVIIDAIFGIGLSRPLEGRFAEVVGNIRKSNVPVLSVDIPSGIHTDTGAVLGTAVRADATVTFACAKPGLLLEPGRTHTGRLLVREIGIRIDAEKQETPWYQAVEQEDLAKFLYRSPMGNKGTFGKVLVIAGSEKMCGAAVLCARAVLAAGAGMVKVMTEERNRIPLFCAVPESMGDFWHSGSIQKEDGILQEECKTALQNNLQWADSVVIGPGISTSKEAKALLRETLLTAKIPVIVDADGLNLIAEDPEILRGTDAPLVFTPHMGELSRLLQKSIAELKKDPAKGALEVCERYRVCCVEKDAVTITAVKNEKEERYYINKSGCSALATAGSGDVLSGILGAYAAKMKCEGKAPFPLSAALAVYAHGRAGQIAAQKASEASVTASMVIEGLQKITER